MEQRGAAAGGVVVEFVEQQNVRSNAANHGRERDGLRVGAARQITRQLPGGTAVQAGVEGRDTQRFGRQRRRADREQQREQGTVSGG
ncbi:MAG: hypothetical protein R3E65_09565 [Steroidobacteraceae bacterium]